MISAIYKEQLTKKVRKLDSMLDETQQFEEIVNEITEEQIDHSILALIKKLGVLKREQTIPEKSLNQEEVIELLYKYLGAIKVEEIIQDLKDSRNVSIEEQFKKLDALIGLERVKQQVHDLMSFNKIQSLRVTQGLKESDKTLHMAFLGNPGTAKTTVARIVGRMYKAMGFLSKGHFIEASRTDLIAEYQGQTANKVKRLINRAKGGVLFIDEAYSLTENENSDSYGRESLTELTKALEDYRRDLVVIVAGYPDLMEHFFNSNPGLKSRFNTFITFDDYSLENLLEIFKYICKENDYVIKNEALVKVSNMIQKKLNEEDLHFSNGRFVRNLFDDIILNQSKRLINQPYPIEKESLMLITEEDIF